MEGIEARATGRACDVVQLVGIPGEVVELALTGRVLDVGVCREPQSLELGDPAPPG